MNEHPLFGLASEILRVVDDEKIPYMLMGGMSVRFWALPRPTYDLDLTLSADEGQIGPLLDRLDREGFVVPPEFRKGWRDTLKGMKKFSVRRFQGRDSWRIDLFLVTTEYQRAAFARRRRAKLLGSDVWTIAPEDLVLHKLMAGRERDIADVAEVLGLTRGLDLPYLHKWAATLNIGDVLEERLRRAGLGEGPDRSPSSQSPS